MIKYNRRDFIRDASMAGVALGLDYPQTLLGSTLPDQKGKRIGVIGLDTSHSEIFTKIINKGKANARGYKVVAAYPHGSPDISSALAMKPGIIKEMRKMDIEIVESISDLLSKVDVVLLETIDGRPHLEQVMPVFEASKRVFIDKPLAQNLAGAKAIIDASKKYNVPFFSSSALRFDNNVSKVVSGSIGKVTGADVYTPAEMDPHHLDLAWYGIHGVEMLYTVMGTGCVSVCRTYQEGTDLVVGVWGDGRIGTVRGIRTGTATIAGTAFGEKGIAPLGPFSSYEPLVAKILEFFDTGTPPFHQEETLEIFRFMHAADLSKEAGGEAILMSSF